VLDRPNTWHVVPGGHPQPPQSLFDGLLDELLDEAGIGRTRVRSALCTGFLRAAGTEKPEVTFLLKIDASFAEIIHRRSKESWEFERYHAIPWEPRQIEDWLTSRNHAIADAGHGCVLVAGAADFGEAWLAGVLARLGC